MYILLVCSSGMSTSLIVSRMRKVAKETGKKDYKIEAISLDCAVDYYEVADVILIGPQISNMKEQIAYASGKPIEVMDRKNYGRCKGEEILKEAEDVYSTNMLRRNHG